MASTKKEDTRRRLLDVARKLFQTHGFHGVGLEEIAEAAGVSRQAVYKSHFSSKADLVLELTRHVHVAENFEDLIQLTRAATTGAAKLEQTIASIVAIQAKIHDLAVVLSAAARTDAGAKAAWAEAMGGQHGGIRRAFELVRTEGRLNPNWKLEQAVDVVAVLLSTDSYQQLVVERGWKPDALASYIWALCQASMLVEPQRDAGKPKPRR